LRERGYSSPKTQKRERKVEKTQKEINRERGYSSPKTQKRERKVEKTQKEINSNHRSIFWFKETIKKISNYSKTTPKQYIKTGLSQTNWRNTNQASIIIR
jgi:hypothetical protein